MLLYTYKLFDAHEPLCMRIRAREFKDFADYVKKHGADIEVRTALYSVGIFFEGIGVLAKRKLINMDLVDDLFSAPLSQTWGRMGPIVKGMREQENRRKDLHLGSGSNMFMMK